MRTLRLGLVLVMGGLALPSVPASSSPLKPCTSAVHLPGVGEACRHANGMYELFSPRTGRSLGFTHGPDAPEPVAASTASGETTTSQRKVVCAAPTDYHVELIYARPADDTDSYSSRAASLRTAVEKINWTLNESAKATGAGSADYKLHCTNGVATVRNVVLPTTKANDSFGSIMEDLTARGYANTRTKYLVLYDDSLSCGCSGLAQAPVDDRLSSDNAGLRGPMYAVALSVSTRTLMHELSHTMGAVQYSAPHSTQAAHCYDGSDVMCYRDGGPKSNLYSTSYCSSGLIFDCNKDDYFSAVPRAGSYLATHWNLGSRLNRYIKFPAVSDTVPPVISWTEPRAGNTYMGGCSSRMQTGSERPIFQGTKGCIRAMPTDAQTGVDRLDVYLDGRLVGTFSQFPTINVSFELGRGPGVAVPLKLVATDFAEIPRGPNTATTTILVDIV